MKGDGLFKVKDKQLLLKRKQPCKLNCSYGKVSHTLKKKLNKK